MTDPFRVRYSDENKKNNAFNNEHGLKKIRVNRS